MSSSDLPAVAAVLRAHDPGRFLTTLMAPPGLREALLALYAFDCEIARVRHVVTQPMAGLIRLQWWRDVLAGIAAGETREHPVVLGLAAAWPLLGAGRNELERAIDARERELEELPFTDMAALGDHAAAVGGTIGRTALLATGGGDRGAAEAAECVGRAYALLALLRETPADIAAGRVIFPLGLLKEHGMDPEAALAGASSGALVAPGRAVAERAGAWLDQARRHAVVRRCLPALLPGTVVRRGLTRFRQAGHDPLASGWRRPDPALPLVLLARRAIGRF
jgi:NADH dehydrogenase [ubiquinone] 1 alpha subcomplex assembly factor 6